MTRQERKRLTTTGRTLAKRSGMDARAMIADAAKQLGHKHMVCVIDETAPIPQSAWIRLVDLIRKNKG